MNTINNCKEIINNYLAHNGSSDFAIEILDTAIENDSWLLPWTRLKKETEKSNDDFEKKELKDIKIKKIYY